MITYGVQPQNYHTVWKVILSQQFFFLKKKSYNENLLWN